MTDAVNESDQKRGTSTHRLGVVQPQSSSPPLLFHFLPSAQGLETPLHANLISSWLSAF